MFAHRLARSARCPHNTRRPRRIAQPAREVRLPPLLSDRETQARRADAATRGASANTVRIVSASGVPGSIGFFAITKHDGQLVLVTAYHVLFGGGARSAEGVWLAEDAGNGPAFHPVGRALYGRAGLVRGSAVETYVDCAAASVDSQFMRSPASEGRTACQAIASSIAPGDRVTKIGAATAWTEGIVVDADYRARAVRYGGTDAPGQILVRSSSPGRPFSADGDSGAALLDESGRLAGLLWALTARGESLVCPISAVVHVLNVDPVGITAAPMRALVFPSDFAKWRHTTSW